MTIFHPKRLAFPACTIGTFSSCFGFYPGTASINLCSASRPRFSPRIFHAFHDFSPDTVGHHGRPTPGLPCALLSCFPIAFEPLVLVHFLSTTTKIQSVSLLNLCVPWCQPVRILPYHKLPCSPPKPLIASRLLDPCVPTKLFFFFRSPFS